MMADGPVALVVGANRGIGLGVVKELLRRGWNVIATARQPAQAAELAALAQSHPGRVSIEPLDLNDPKQLDQFADRLAGRTLDVALVNAGIAGPAHMSAGAATMDEIGALMFTNAIAPIRLARHLIGLMRPNTGIIGFTSSVMGSVALNTGGHELYRASKAALNSLTRGLYGEVGSRRLTVLTLHPGWVRTDMGGPGAPVSVEQSASGLVKVLEGEKGSHRHAFIDYTGAEIAW
jgi:NAD(P)-dependent dehydrogenase (short-subunit alcohol dehydrogenase family)